MAKIQKCHNCGGEVVYEPGTQNMVCPWCGSKTPFEVEDIPLEEQDYATMLDELEAKVPRLPAIDMIKCQACGASFSPPEGDDGGPCPFCATPWLRKDSQRRTMIAPQGVLPFVLTQKQAHEVFKKWLHGLWFAPNNLKKFARKKGKFEGVYTPYWTYDSAMESHYSGLRGTVYYVTDRKGNAQPRMRWDPVSGVVNLNFDDILVLGSTTLPQSETEALEPWPLSSIHSFDKHYLRGFTTEYYRIDFQSGFRQAQNQMSNQMRMAIHQDIGGAQQQITNMTQQYDDVTFKHILLPVWLAAYQYHGRAYRVVINGATGRAKGRRPYSWIKITFAVLLGLILATGVAYVGGAFDDHQNDGSSYGSSTYYNDY